MERVTSGRPHYIDGRISAETFEVVVGLRSPRVQKHGEPIFIFPELFTTQSYCPDRSFKWGGVGVEASRAPHSRGNFYRGQIERKRSGELDSMGVPQTSPWANLSSGTGVAYTLPDHH